MMALRVRRHALPVTVLALMLVLGLAGLRVSAVGTTWYVDDNTCPGTGTGSQANPFCHIQNAICIAVSGDTVSVAPGTYPEAIRVRPGVSVISQGGAAVTTINSSGQPCTDNDFCIKRVGNQCSVVTFPSGAANSTVLDGFTITGGAGLIQSTGGVDKVAGGGIFVFSAPTIMNNVITNNILSGPSPNNKDMRGAGVYVGVGAPLITNNTITGNRAVAPAGTSGNYTFGYGGGVWLSAFSDAVLTNNIITGNLAGDPNVAFSLGSGGGVLSWPPLATITAGQLIDRNMIADNQADSTGGGVSLLSDPNTGSFTAVTNNVIVGNTSRAGGGVYQYYSSVKIFNNTITTNEATLGGGVSLGQGETSLPVSLTNNIIEGNTLRDFGNGGGIYKLDLSATFEPTISFNDLWNNELNNVAGDRNDGNTIGVNGNFSLDPRFVNRPARDFHLDPNSGAIDRATAVGAPAVDKDNLPRGVDGNGIPNNPVAGDVDAGAYERQGACTPTTETCDNIDNDCDLQIDEGLGSTTCGLGACEVTVQNCIGGVPQSCTPGTPGTETCDSIDNDCDGTPDDGLGSTTCGVGVCEVTVQNCIGGVPQSCNPGSPVPEQCDNLDNDCDGSTDEELGATTCGVGACQVTVQNCVNGNSQSCTPGSGSAETCDGVDNDCDGTTDEGFPDSDGDTLPDCTDPDDDNDSALDVADCAPMNNTAFGMPYEVANVQVSSAGPHTGVQYDTQAIGSGTKYQVLSGSLLRLLATQGFQEGFCLDEEVTGGEYLDIRPAPRVGEGWFYQVRSVNACGLGTLGSPLRDAPGAGDVCQLGHVDNDSDGSPSHLDCNDGNPNISPLAPEVCDNIDNDCDLQVDDGNPGGGASCGTDVGECSFGTMTCTGGSLTCQGGVGPVTETCDGLDNNCDGASDDGNPGGGATCGTDVGECSTGITACAGGSLACQGGVGPVAETCDGLDNDCDTLTDNGFPDTDTDAQADCVDPDDDNDLALDGADCAPLDATAFAVPTEVQDLDVQNGAPTPIVWMVQALGSGTVYDVATGQIATPGTLVFPEGTCLTGVPAPPASDERPAPAVGTAWYYMVKSRNNCGAGTYGSPARDAHPACP